MKKKEYKRRALTLDINGIIEIVGSIISLIDTLINRIKEYIEDKNFQDFLEFVSEKIENDVNNTDKSYISIGDNCYIKNFIGFESFEDIDKFLNINYDIYKKTFPNKACAIFAILCFIVSIFIIIISICILMNNDKNNIIVIHLIFFMISFVFFLGFICYFGKILPVHYNKDVLSKIKDIKADEFIINFLREFEKKIKTRQFINTVISFLTISFFFHLISFITALTGLC